MKRSFSWFYKGESNLQFSSLSSRLDSITYERSFVRGRSSVFNEAAKLAADNFFDNEVDESDLILYGYDGERFQY